MKLLLTGLFQVYYLQRTEGLDVKKRHIFWIILLSLVIGFYLFQNTNDSVSDSENSTPNIFVFCSEGSPRFLNPQVASDGTSFDAISDVYDGLVEFKRGTSIIQPNLAKSWKISKDGLQYTFYLRQDVSFHTTKNFTPTRKMNADDVLFSFKRFFDKSHPFHKVSGGNYMYFFAMGLDKVLKDVVKINNSTVRFDLKEVSATFLVSLAMQFPVVLSKEYGDQLIQQKRKGDIDHIPVGTGPFILTDYKKDSLIRYKTNKKYFKAPSSLSGMVFSITPDASVRFQKLKREECHLMSFPSPSDYEAIANHEKLKLIKSEVYNVAYLGMNVKKTPLDNKFIRQAIHHALNRSLYVKAIYLGNAQIAKGPIPPRMWSYNKNIKVYEYDVKKAKELLKKAGYEKGFDIDLWVLPVSRPYNPDGKKMGELMKEDLAQVGINVHLVNYDWVTYLQKTQKAEHALVQMGWTSDNGDPDNFLGTLLSCTSLTSGTNLAQWCNKPFSQLVKKASQTLNQKEREELYKKAQEIFAEESPWVPLVHTYGFRGSNKKVQGYILAPHGSESFYGVTLSR